MKIAFLLTINGWWYDEIKISSEMKKRIYKHVKNIQDKKTLRIDYAVGYYLQYLMRLLLPLKVFLDLFFQYFLH